MAMNMAKVFLVGSIIRKPEVKQVSGNATVANFRMVINFKKKSGDKWIEDPCYWDVEVWGKNVHSLADYLDTGSEVTVNGDTKEGRWKNKDTGENRSKHKCVTNMQGVSFGRKRERDDGDGPVRGGNSSPPPGREDPESDIPF